MAFLTFPPLAAHPGLIHGFSLRRPDNRESDGPEQILPSFGMDPRQIVQAEQLHGNRVACVDPSHTGTTVKNVDALLTSTPGVILVIRTADCAPVFLRDSTNKAIGLIHSGKKGTALNIVEAAVRAMGDQFGSSPEMLQAVIGPCIRPPDYEIDIAAAIRCQLKDCGVRDCFDCGENTASDLDRFYSYRKENGQTGRHYAFFSFSL